MLKIKITALLFMCTTISQVMADVRATYNCQSMGYVEINHEGRVKDIELEEFTLHFEGPYMVMKVVLAGFYPQSSHIKSIRNLRWCLATN